MKTSKKIGVAVFCLILFLIATEAASAKTIWELGRRDGSAAEFLLQYTPWEYGRTPQLANHPALKDFVFTYRIHENGALYQVPMVSGISSENFRAWMYPNEIVTGLRLVWQEKQSGNRELTLYFAGWRNNGDNKDTLELILPDNSRDYLSLPQKLQEKQFTRRVVFPVFAGENTLQLNAIGNGKYFQVKFDSIHLQESSEQIQLGQHLRFKFNGFSQIYHPGDRIKIQVEALRIPDGKLEWTLTDAFEKKISSGYIPLRQEQGIIEFTAVKRGCFQLKCQTADITGSTSFVVIEPVTSEELPESRFGAHALPMDSYLPVWDEKTAERNIRRAALAGVKHCRYHSLKWNLIAPSSPDRPDWRIVDQKVALAEKYNMTLLMNPLGTPEWASPVKSRKLASPIGVPQFSVYPPENGAWRQFVTELLTRYKGRVSRYEFWNEPSYHSVFWLDGSPANYAKLVRTGFEAAREADPGARIYSGGLFSAAVGFLEETIKFNAGKLYFDVMGIHYPNRDIYQAWRTLLDKNNGADVALVNTEGSAFGREATSLQQGGKIVKSYVIDAANHVKQTYGFLFFDNNKERQVQDFFDSNGNPQPAYAAFRTMTHRLEGANYLSDISSDHVSAHLFERDGEAVMVLWALVPEGKINLYNLPKQMTLINLMDQEEKLEVSKKLELTLTSLPVFLEGGNPILLQKAGEIQSFFRKKIHIRPGETVRRRLPFSTKSVKIVLRTPKNWSVHLEPQEMLLTSSPKTEDGNYRLVGEAVFSLHSQTYQIPLELQVNVSSQPAGTNLLRNGNFSQGTAFWWFWKNTEAKFSKDAMGEPLLEVSSTTFGPVGTIRVQPGERYLISTRAEGDGGTFGVMYSLFDRHGKRIYPTKDGLNLLQNRSTPERRSYHAILNITQPNAERMSLLMLANLGTPKGKTRFEYFRLFRLDGQYEISKLLFQGICTATSQPVTIDGKLDEWKAAPAMRLHSAEWVAGEDWGGPEDISVAARLMKDQQNFYFSFVVKDNLFHQQTPEQPWLGDSIQFSIDPLLDCLDYHEFTVFRDNLGNGQIIRNHLYWTPELPTKLTRIGKLPDAEVAIRPIPGGMIYEGKIPFTQLFPLNPKTMEFGFSFLVNDSDGKGRKYIRWSDGIGGKKNPAEFGFIRVQ